MTIPTFDSAARLSQPMKVGITFTGQISALTIWLNDSVSESDVIAQNGLESNGTLTLALVPKTVGSWHLWARVTDMLGCAAQTGLVRTVVVTP